MLAVPDAGTVLLPLAGGPGWGARRALPPAASAGAWAPVEGAGVGPRVPAR